MYRILYWVILGVIVAFLYRFCSPPIVKSHLVGDRRQIIYFKGLQEFTEFNYQKKVIVDVGCGNGNLANFFISEKGLPNTFGIDLAHVIERTKGEYPHLSEQYKVGSAENMPFDDLSVDLLIFQDSFHHVADYDSTVSEISRVLKSGGKVIFLEPVIVKGSKYEVDELIEIFVPDLERPVRDEAYGKIKNVEKEYPGKSLKLSSVEKEFVFRDVTVEKFRNGMKFHRPEEYKREKNRFEEYIKKVSEEDGIEIEELRFFATRRLNMWVKE